jgi:hypothetical protein
MDDEPLFISRQILREYLAAMTRQQVWGKALSLAEAIADTLVFAQRFTVLEDGPPVWAQLVATRSAAVRFMTRTSSRRCWRMASAGC